MLNTRVVTSAVKWTLASITEHADLIFHRYTGDDGRYNTCVVLLFLRLVKCMEQVSRLLAVQMG